jgi:crotonobetainyl-CoA:carnitine CoA-transferase CaiB-like acyl-CoA transferase
MLRDLGARIIRVERMAQKNSAEGKYKGMDVTFPIRSLTAGTEALSLDLKHEKGMEVFKKLVAQTDVVLEGFRPGVMQRLGIDYASLSKNKPELLYAAITGFGQSGAYKDKVGHDINYLAETGVLALTNPVGLPGATFADGMAGVSAALNIVAAIHAKTKSDEGQMIDCAIIDGPLSLMTAEFEYYWNSGRAHTAGDHHLSGSHPWYGIYRTHDGEQVVIGAVEPVFYQTLCHALGLPELANQQFAEGEELKQAREKIAKAIASRTRDEILHLFETHPACVSPIAKTAEVAASPLMQRMLRDNHQIHQNLVRTPVRLPLAELPAEQSGSRILASLGFTKNEIEELLTLGIIGGV